MFPFQKIFTMLIRTFSRPMLGYVKKKQIERPGSRFARFFVGLGRRAQIFEHWVNLRVLRTTKHRQLVQLKEEILLQKGIESFYEALFYIIVLGLPFWELYRSSIAAQKKEEALQNRIANLEKKMVHINQRIGKVVEYAKERSKQDKARQIRRSQLKDINLNHKKEEKDLNMKMQALGEATSSPEGESISQKIQQLFENAIEVMADEFEDSLDDLEFSNPTFEPGSELQSVDDANSADSQLDSIQLDAQQSSTDLLLQDIVETDAASQITVDNIDTEIQVDVSADVSSDSE